MQLTDNMREETKTDNDIIKSNKYALATDTALHMTAPKSKTEVPFIDFSPLQNALNTLQVSTDSLSIRWSAETITSSNLNSFNSRIFKAEQQLLLPEGLPRRSWYKHAIYAPGYYTGYGVKTLPGIREAIEQRNWKEAKEQIAAAAAVINQLSAYLNSIQ